MARFVPVMRDFFARTTAAWRKRVIVWVSANTAFWAGDALALAVGTWLTIQGSITVGTAYLILQYAQLVRRPIEQVTQELQQLQKAAGGIIRIDQLRRLDTKLIDGASRLPAGALAIEFERVRFSYEDRVVLDDVNFRLEPGTVLGLLGRTGGGKTTITRLIARLYDPDAGAVRIGEIDLREASFDSLRHGPRRRDPGRPAFPGHRPRQPHPVRGHGRRRDPPDPRSGGPGYLDPDDRPRQPELGSGGQGLSAGEQQLLAFARVFLQDPGVVILDEPSSRLDPATEALLAVATERLFSGRTVVIVAHRLETVRTADEIMVVESGQVVEHGPRERPGGGPGQPLLPAAGGREGLQRLAGAPGRGHGHDRRPGQHVPHPVGDGQVPPVALSASA